MTARPALYTVDELVEAFGGRRRRSAIYEDIRKGSIPSVSLGRRVFVPGWYVQQLRDGEHPVITTPVTSGNDPGTRPPA